MKYIISCEHGGNEIPPAYLEHFIAHKDLLNSHRGWDKGSLEIAKYFASVLKANLVYSTTSRLLIEQNRTLKHEELFSTISKDFEDEAKEKLIKEIYLPYLNQLDSLIEQAINGQTPFVHISVHSFTPVLNGKTRTAEVGLLFDPEKEAELKFAELWHEDLSKNNPEWRVKMNYPYLGTDDGLVTFFRQKYEEKYVGIELEMNSRLFDDYPVFEIAERLMPPLN